VTTSDFDALLKSEEADAYLGLRPRTLEAARGRQDGRYPAFIRIGGKAIRYRKSVLDEYLAKRTVQYPLNQAA
jgi:predicted DNA-binding transcriptional regulator AlpA